MRQKKKNPESMSAEELKNYCKDLAKQQKNLNAMIKIKEREEEAERKRREYEEKVSFAMKFLEWGKTIKFSDGKTAYDHFVSLTQQADRHVNESQKDDNSSASDSFEDESSESAGGIQYDQM